MKMLGCVSWDSSRIAGCWVVRICFMDCNRPSKVLTPYRGILVVVNYQVRIVLAVSHC